MTSGQLPWPWLRKRACFYIMMWKPKKSTFSRKGGQEVEKVSINYLPNAVTDPWQYLKEGDIYFGSQFQRIQATVAWAFVLVLKSQRQGHAGNDSWSLMAAGEVESWQEAARHNGHRQGLTSCETFFLQLDKLLKLQQAPQMVPPAGDQSLKTLDRKKISYSLCSHVQKGIILMFV